MSPTIKLPVGQFRSSPHGPPAPRPHGPTDAESREQGAGQQVVRLGQDQGDSCVSVEISGIYRVGWAGRELRNRGFVERYQVATLES